MTAFNEGDPASRELGPGGRYAREGVLLALQAPTTGNPRSSLMQTATDPMLPPKTAAQRLEHFFAGLYDTRPESHLSRLLKVLLGDSGAGLLRKRYLGARLQSVVLTLRYHDMDRLYGQLFGFRRLSREALDIDAWSSTATPEEWDEIDTRDAAYRSRIEAFSRSIPLAGTEEGMAAAAAALLGVECQIYETYSLVDEEGGNAGGAPPAVGARTYGDVEQDFPYYQSFTGTYADIEGGSGSFGRTTTQNRAEFVVRPKRAITLEEGYELMRVLTRLKPADALLTIDPLGVAIHSQIQIRDVAADSTYWEVQTKVAPRQTLATPSGPLGWNPTTQPKPTFSSYQGEAWSYNSDVARVASYSEGSTGARTSTVNYERVTGPTGKPLDLSPDRAIADPKALMLGRAASDAVLLASPYDPQRGKAKVSR